MSKILHLSDLHFGTIKEARIWYGQLAEDLTRELKCDRLDAIVLSGDIANLSAEAEYQAAKRFLDDLCNEFKVDMRRVIVVPGNHDLSWKVSQKAYRRMRGSRSAHLADPDHSYEKDGILYIRDEVRYTERFVHFSAFYKSIAGVAYSTDYGEQYSLQHFPDLDLLVLGLNSAWDLDHHYTTRVSINPTAISNALTEIRRTPAYRDSLKLAVWHHPLISPYEDRIKDHGFAEQLAKAGFRFGLHGHIHKAEKNLFQYDYDAEGRKLDIIGAGTFGAPTRELVPGYPWQYNLLRIEGNILRVETRRREEPNGAWKPDARWTRKEGELPTPYYSITIKARSAESLTGKTKKLSWRAQPSVSDLAAGDNITLLWVARRAVQLLDPAIGLRRVVVQNVSSSGEPPQASDEDYFLGVDLSEYYGGEDFQTATRVVASQLKYSTRHPSRAWTASRLCAAGTNRSASVVRRLADVYKGYVAGASREDVVTKLTIRLVSNQPADAKSQAALEAAKKILGTNGTDTAPVATANLLKKLSAGHRAVIEQLRSKAGLSSTEFTDLLRVLDLSACGEEARSFQRLRLIQELAPSVSASPVAALRNLRELVEREAQPEGRNSRGLTEADVIAALEVSHKDDLFPAPSHLKLPENFIETSDARELAAAVSAAASGRVLAHGDAGVGKTTTVQSLASHLPPGSVVITYDCYGGGSYLVMGEQRHTNSRAFMQLTNELAVRCGTPFLIRPSREKYDLQREFRRALGAASKIVAAQGGMLVIAVDAADNAVVAVAAAGDDDCFVPALWTTPLPDGSRLLMTSRSHRRQTLKPPDDIVEYELTGFDRRASTEHLRMLFPKADDTEGATFHDRTGGNPRVQYYLLDRAKTDKKDEGALERLLAASNRTPNSLFADLLDAAVRYAPVPEDARRLLSVLICLSRPAPLRIFADACAIEFDEARNFCRALVPGLIIEDEEVSFRDEDFETYLRGQVSKREIVAAHDNLANFFAPRSGTNPYAARVVAEHLAQAGRHADLISLAVDGPEPLGVSDQMQRLQIIRRRVSLAMQAAGLLGRGAEAVRLTLLAAEAARSDGAVTALVRENPELAARYGDAQSVARLYTRTENNEWLGAAHLRAAAIYARDPAQRDRAAEHMRHAEAWIRRWSTLPQNKRYGWRITARDVAAGTEAIFWLVGADHARDWLRHWRPVSFVIKAVEELGTSLAGSLTPEEQEQHLSSLGLPARAVAALLASMWKAGGTPARSLVEYAAKNLDRFLKREARVRRREEKRYISEDKSFWPVSFCELAALLGTDSELTLRLTRALCPAIPDTDPHRNFAHPYYDPMRAACLDAALSGRELSTGHLMPERFRRKAGENEHRYDSERRAFSEAIGNVVGIFKLRARTLIKPAVVADIAADITSDLKSYRERSEHRWFKSDHQYSTWAQKACETLLGCAGDAEALFEEIAALAERTMPGGAAWLWKDMAEMLARRDAYRPLAYQLLERAALRVAEQPVPAQERWELLLRCSEIASRYDEALGRDYYGRALSAAEGVDDDIVPLLSLESRLASKAAPFATGEERRSFAARLARNVEAHEKFVSERKQEVWEQALGAVTRLDPAAGAALCSRWDDENRLDVDDGIIPFVREATGSNYLTPLEGLSLLRLADERFDISEAFLHVLNRLTEAGPTARQQLTHAIQMVSNWIRRDVPLRYRKEAAERVIAWAETHGLGQLAVISDLRVLASFAASFSAEGDAEQTYSFRRGESEEATREALFVDARRGSLENLDDRVDAVWRTSSRGEGVREFLVALGRSVVPSRRVEFLDAVVAIKPDRVYAQYMTEALGDVLNEWRSSAPVREWAERGLGAFFENHLPAVVAYGYNASENLNAVLSVPQLIGYPRAAVLLPAVTKHIEVLGPRSLYLMAEALAATLEDAALREVLDWSLARTERRLEQNGAVMSPLTPVVLPDDAPGTLAHLFWALFGHPDKRVRWRALHAARGVITQPKKLVDEGRLRQLIGELLGLRDSATAGAFRSESLEFYPMSARVWLLLLLERVADETPEYLATHARAVADIALDKEFPHAQARELAKRAALRIAERVPSAFPPAVVDELTRANRPSSCLYPRGNAYGSRYGRDESGEQEGSRASRRFRFNWMDTERYWYSAVSDIFGAPPPDLDVTARAEVWICDHWGRSEQDWWKDPREIGDRYKWQQMENSQGQTPPVENMRTYLEYHAMFCAAGEMADQLPANVRTWDYDNEENVSDPWEEWIDGHVSASQDCWLADLRSPTPYRPDGWGQFPPLEEWLRRDNVAEYDAELGFGGAKHGTEIVVRGYVNTGDSARRGTARVTSALVSPDTALSLVRALQAAPNPRYFVLPVEEHGFGDNEIDEEGFEVKAWLDDRRFEEGLDEFDPLSRGVRASFMTFGKDFLNVMGLSLTPGTRRYRSLDGSEVAHLEIWNDSPETERTTEPFSEGERLWLRLDVLLEYLRRRGRDLIMEVHIRRNKEHRQRDEEEKYDQGGSRIYLLRRDGRLETLDGSRQVG